MDLFDLIDDYIGEDDNSDDEINSNMNTMNNNNNINININNNDDDDFLNSLRDIASKITAPPPTPSSIFKLKSIFTPLKFFFLILF